MTVPPVTRSTSARLSILLAILVALMFFVQSPRAASTWSTAAPLPSPRWAHGTGTLNGTVHVVGGASAQTTCSFLNTHDAYDPETSTWTSRAPMHVQRVHPGVIEASNGTKNLLYVFGGSTSCGFRTDSVEAYDADSNTWVMKPPMPGGERNSPGVVVLNGLIYVVGGQQNDGGSPYLSVVEVFDPLHDTWSTAAPLPQPRSDMVIGVLNGKILVGGGNQGTSTAVYDPMSNAWSAGPAMLAWQSSAASAVVNGRLYAIGGNFNGTLSTVEFYDASSNTWAFDASLPSPRQELGAGAVGTNIYVPGGFDATVPSIATTNFVLATADTTPPVTTASESPMANGNGWHNDNSVLVTLTANDNGGSGVQSITYSLSGAQNGGGTVSAASASFTVTNEGVTTITYHAQDQSANVESNQTLKVQIDRTPPAISAPFAITTQAQTSAGAPVTFTFNASDSLSSVVSAFAAPKQSGDTFPLGTTHETVTAIDAAGNTAMTGFDVTVNPSRPNITVTGGSFPSDGNAHAATAVAKDFAVPTSNVVQGSFAFAYFPGGSQAPTAVGRYGVSATFTSGDPAFLNVFPWTAKAGDPNAKYSPSAAAISGKLYVYGYDAVGGSSGAPRLSIFDTFQNTWSVGASPSMTRAYASAAAINGKLYVVGGCQQADCRIGVQAARLLEIYDPASNTWTTGASMPTGRYSASSGVINGKLIVTGGTTECPPCVPNYATEIYDPATNSWATAKPIPASRELAASEVANGKLYVIGGAERDTNTSYVATVLIYDPVANTWSSGSAMPTARSGAAAGNLNGELYVIGGVAGGTVTNASESYNPFNDTWTERPPMPTARTWASAVVNNGLLYVIDGNGGAAPSSALETYDGSTAATIIINAVDSVPPTTTANVPAANVNGWYNFNSVQVSLNAGDSGGQAPASGVQSITYSLSGATTQAATTQNGNNLQFSVFNEGITTVAYHATDVQGNVEADHTLTIRIDRTAPVASQANISVPATGPSGAVVTFTPMTSDGLSGVDTVSQTQGPASGSTFSIGTTQVQFKVTDKAGNNTLLNFSVMVTKVLQSITVSPSSATMTVGDNQQFAATGHFSDGTSSFLPTSGGDGGGGVISGSAWAVQFNDLFNTTQCGANQSFNEQGLPAMTGPVQTTWGQSGGVQVAVTGTITASDVTLTLSCTPSNGSNSGSATAHWTGTRYEGTWSFSNTTGHLTITGWSSKASLSPARFSLGAATVNGIVYAIGGGDPSQAMSVSAYDPQADSWTTKSALPTSVEGPGVAALNGFIYVAGGHVSNPAGAASAIFQRYDPANDSWMALNPMPTARAELVLVVAGGKLYAIGGEAGTGSTAGLTTVEMYDPSTGNWTAKASMTSGRKFFAAGTLVDATGKTIIAAAGGNGNSVELYDVTGNSWTAGPSMLSQGGSPTGVVVNNAMFVFGIGGNGVHMFRPTNIDPNRPSGWSALAPMITGRVEMGATAVGDVVYTIAGLVAGTNNSSTAVEAFSTPPPLNFTTSSGNNGGGGGGGLPVVTFSSSDGSIIGVTGSGFATANMAGQATIIATAGGISCQTAGACASVTVNAPVQPAHLTINLAPGSVSFPTVNVTLVDPVTNEVQDGPFDIPIGQPQTIDNPDGTTGRLLFTAPQGYTISPDHVDLTPHPGDNLVVSVFFESTTPPSVSIGNVTLAEGNTGTSSATFTVMLSNATSQTVTVNYATADGTATVADNDYQATNGTLTFAPGETTKTIAVSIVGDTAFEPDEMFTVALSGAANATIGTATGTGTIVNDDVDNTPPVFSNVPGPITVEATGLATAVSYTGPTATDAVDGDRAVTCAPASGATFGLGTTAVTCSASDTHGNAASASFNVTVQDTTKPSITAPADVTVEATGNGGAFVNPGTPTTFDLVGPVTVTGGAPGQYALGTTTLTWTATDESGNKATATQTINVVDTIKPALSLPGSITVDATSPSGAVVTYVASASDIVSGTVAVVCSKASGSTFPIGTTVVNCTATDGAGNSTSGSFTVLVQAAAAQVSNLLAEVQAFNLAQGITNSLDAKLGNMLSALNAAQSGNVSNVCGQLEAFINQVAAQSGKSLTVAQAAQLTADAQRIQAVVGCN